MKNLLYILIGVGFLAIISSSASGFLTTETSYTLDNLYKENFYIDPESVILLENEVSVTLVQYKSEYEDKTIECSILINQNIAVEKDCVLISGEFAKQEEKEIVTITKDTSC